MDYYIGVDSGGTKTEFILADENGHIERRLVDCGCNPLDVGVMAARDTVFKNLKKLRDEAPGDIVSIYAGIAGVNHIDIGIEPMVMAVMPKAAVKVEDDRRIVVSGTLGHADGCGLICGTGSSLSIIVEGQPIRQVGGLGYLIDTGGSGYELGQAALKYAFRYLDGRGEYTILAELLTEALGKSPWNALGDIYRGGRSYIASLGCLVFEGKAARDKVCEDIIDKAAFKLSELTYAAEKYFDDNFPVVMTGGILNAYPAYTELVCRKASKRAKMIMAVVPPVYGAIVEAMQQAGRGADEEVRSSFMLDYAEIACDKNSGSHQRDLTYICGKGSGRIDG